MSRAVSIDLTSARPGWWPRTQRCTCRSSGCSRSLEPRVWRAGGPWRRAAGGLTSQAWQLRCSSHDQQSYPGTSPSSPTSITSTTRSGYEVCVALAIGDGVWLVWCGWARGSDASQLLFTVCSPQKQAMWCSGYVLRRRQHTACPRHVAGRGSGG